MGTIVALLILSIPITWYQGCTAKNEIEEADKLWNQGNKAAAADIYERVIEGNASFIKEGREYVYLCAIEQRFSQGQIQQARKLIEYAKYNKAVITSRVPKVQQLITQVYAETTDPRR